MKIGIVTQQTHDLHIAILNVNEALFDRPFGDDATVLKQLGERIGHLSVLVLSSTPRALLELSPTVRLIAAEGTSRTGGLLAMARGLSACHRERPIHLIQAQEAPYTGLAALGVARRVGAKLSIGVFGSDPADPGFRNASWGHRLAAPLGEFVLRHADAVQTDSRYAAEQLAARGLPAFYKAMTPLNLREFIAAGGNRDHAANGENLLFVGRLGRQKNIGLLLHAFAELRAKRPEVRLTLIGDGPDRVAIENSIGELGLGEAVELRGQIPHDDLPDAYLRADVLVMTSHYEGMPRAFLEAGATELPIVSTRVTGALELAEAAPLWLADGTPSDVAERLDNALADGERRQRCGTMLASAVRRRLEEPAPPDQQVAIWRRTCDAS